MSVIPLSHEANQVSKIASRNWPGSNVRSDLSPFELCNVLLIMYAQVLVFVSPVNPVARVKL